MRQGWGAHSRMAEMLVAQAQVGAVEMVQGKWEKTRCVGSLVLALSGGLGGVKNNFWILLTLAMIEHIRLNLTENSYKSWTKCTFWRTNSRGMT